MRSKLRAVGGVVLAFSLACAGGEALEQEHGQAEPAPEPNQEASSARAAEGAPGSGESAVFGNGETPDITEGSNTNWRPIDPELGSEPIVKPARSGSPGSTPLSVTAAPTSTTTPSNTASTAPSSTTNTSNSSSTSPSPVAP